jgi:HSP90 family molecular chaperone
MLKLLPWLCVLVLLIGLGWVYSAGQKKDAELAALRQDSQQLETLRAELEEARKAHTQADSDELARLRKDSEDVLRLRNEVGQLRKEKQQMAAQLQAAQVQAQGAQEQVQTLRANQQQAPAPNRPNLEQAQATACINNLRQIEGAKAQWALDHHKPAGALLTMADLAPYFKSNAVPTCPAGGVYTLNPVGLAPLCSIPGHVLPK